MVGIPAAIIHHLDALRKSLLFSYEDRRYRKVFVQFRLQSLTQFKLMSNFKKMWFLVRRKGKKRQIVLALFISYEKFMSFLLFARCIQVCFTRGIEYVVCGSFNVTLPYVELVYVLIGVQLFIVGSGRSFRKVVRSVARVTYHSLLSCNDHILQI